MAIVNRIDEEDDPLAARTARLKNLKGLAAAATGTAPPALNFLAAPTAKTALAYQASQVPGAAPQVPQVPQLAPDAIATGDPAVQGSGPLAASADGAYGGVYRGIGQIPGMVGQGMDALGRAYARGAPSNPAPPAPGGPLAQVAARFTNVDADRASTPVAPQFAPNGARVQNVGPTVDAGALPPKTGTPLVQYAQADQPGVLGQVGSVQSMPASSFTALDPATSRALAAAKSANVANDPYGDAPGYRGPLANGSAYGTPGPGMNRDEFDMSQALAHGDLKKAGLIRGLIGDRQAIERNDEGFKNANSSLAASATANLQGAQAGEAGARARSTTELIPANKAKALADAARDRATAAKDLGLLPGQQEQLSLANQSGQLQLGQAKQLEELRTKALTSGKPEDLGAYNTAIRASQGKLGTLTDEDILKNHNEYLVAHTKAFAMSPKAPEAMSFQEYKASVTGAASTKPTPPLNHILALKQDPKKFTAEFDEQYGKGAAKKYLNGK